jgi:hypothetical protein
MIRRRPRSREIPFSFDSFLDVVANVVGIIIRLILVAWVGARSYSSLSRVPRRPGQALVATAQAALHTPLEDPLQQELARHRQELEEAQRRLLEQLRQLHLLQAEQVQAKEQVESLQNTHDQVREEELVLDRQARERSQTHRAVALSLEQLRHRQHQLLDDLRALEKLPPLQRVLRYHTPVSQPVQAEEFMFECREGRVTFIDITSLLADIRDSFRDRGNELRTRWQITEMTRPVGAFQLRYTVERQRGMADSLFGGATPDDKENYRYALQEWVVEPVAPVRGEPVSVALAPGSEFRQVVDRLDNHQAVVTFWVYPDSFGLFRQLRNYVYERDLVVAGRPLPPGIAITCSRQGSVSRGQ